MTMCAALYLGLLLLIFRLSVFICSVTALDEFFAVNKILLFAKVLVVVLCKSVYILLNSAISIIWSNMCNIVSLYFHLSQLLDMYLEC